MRRTNSKMDTNTLLLELLREVKALREDNKLLLDKFYALSVSKQDEL